MSGSEKHIFGVAEVNQFIKTMLDGVPALQDLYAVSYTHLPQRFQNAYGSASFSGFAAAYFIVLEG